MRKTCRYKCTERLFSKKIIGLTLVLSLLTGCAGASKQNTDIVESGRDESATDSHVNFQVLKEVNSDIFAWIFVPDTNIDYPVCQSSDGDDYYYITHNSLKEEDPKGAIYIEAANLQNMCDFNEVLHGNSPSDGTMFADLQKFLDRSFFDEHEYIYVYTEGNALIYYVFAAFPRENTRLVEYYDFTCVYGCQAFLDEIYDSKSMNKLVRTGWEGAVEPDNFIITLSTQNTDDPTKQTVVVGCLVGDVRGEIDRYLDYSEPDENW